MKIAVAYETLEAHYIPVSDLDALQRDKYCIVEATIGRSHDFMTEDYYLIPGTVCDWILPLDAAAPVTWLGVDD